MAEQPRAMFEDQDCITCGVRFGVPFGFTANHRRNKVSFYCPNGHSMGYTESEADKLRRERDRLKQDNARLEEERLAALARAQEAERRETRLTQRASAGVCPCCNRTFRQLARHMSTKHPTFTAEGAQVVSLKRAKK